MKQRIYFSGVGEPDLWTTLSGRSYLDNAAHMHRFFSWDAGPDLAQATWEWPLFVDETAALAIFGQAESKEKYGEYLQEAYGDLSDG